MNYGFKWTWTLILALSFICCVTLGKYSGSLNCVAIGRNNWVIGGIQCQVRRKGECSLDITSLPFTKAREGSL